MRGFGNRKSVSIAGKAAVSHDYEVKNGNLLKSIYANGWEVAYTYDANDCLIKEVQTTPDGVRTVTLSTLAIAPFVSVSVSATDPLRSVPVPV